MLSSEKSSGDERRQAKGTSVFSVTFYYISIEECVCVLDTQVNFF